MVGTLGILEEAAKRGLIDIEQTIQKLRATSFRAHESLYQTLLERVRNLKRDLDQDRDLSASGGDEG
ncbi:MAG: DUF3368 domain-containing protein [Isosphaeraceae bacterium]